LRWRIKERVWTAATHFDLQKEAHSLRMLYDAIMPQLKAMYWCWLCWCIFEALAWYCQNRGRPSQLQPAKEDLEATLGDDFDAAADGGEPNRRQGGTLAGVEKLDNDMTWTWSPISVNFCTG